MAEARDHSELERHVRNLIDATGTLLRVSEEAEKLAVIFPDLTKLEICEFIIARAGAEKIGMELENLDDSGRRKRFLQREERIRRRAYDIWEREGRPEGRASEHWYRAARELDRPGEEETGGR
jgi:Protein of unknown function (DUF2934)